MDPDRLARRFSEQVAFSQGYAPLYARLFGIVEEWLRRPGRESDPLVNWLLNAATGRRTLDVTNLLLAGLHRRVLAHQVDVSTLATFYPTVGGSRSPDHPRLPDYLRESITTNQQELADFIQTATVQTNETARGLAWVLPLSFCPWSEVHLVDLGASAGLNLVADRRIYGLVDPAGIQTVLNEKQPPVQFQTTVSGELSPLSYAGRLPSIAQRNGCDLYPFPLNTPADELTLMSFIWADQPQRLDRLKEGIAAWRDAQNGPAPVHLEAVDLPEELPGYLATIAGKAPVVIYNTYMTVYLSDRGASLREHIGAWAQTQDRPVLWLQWEPAASDVPPATGWCAWTIDWWQGHNHSHWRIGWVHPHGIAAIMEPSIVTAVQHLQNIY